MINTYFTQLEQLFQQFPNIRTYTLTKKIYNTKQGFINGLILFENGYRLDFVEVKNTDVQSKSKYRYQYMGSVKNNLVEFALEFAVDLIDLIEQNRRNSELFRGLLRLKIG
jgi:hypothetical protein